MLQLYYSSIVATSLQSQISLYPPNELFIFAAVLNDNSKITFGHVVNSLTSFSFYYGCPRSLKESSVFNAWNIVPCHEIRRLLVISHCCKQRRKTSGYIGESSVGGRLYLSNDLYIHTLAIHEKVVDNFNVV